MRKSTIPPILVVLGAATAIIIWIRTGPHRTSPDPTTSGVSYRGANRHGLPDASFPPPPALPAPSPARNPESQVLQVGTQQSLALERKETAWRNARGCNDTEYGITYSQSETTLRSWTLNNDLVAANRLAWVLLFMDSSHDGRPEAKKVLWQAMVQGSVCAISTYDMFWRRAHNGERQIVHAGNKNFVHYLLNIPKSDAAKRRALMNDYAWNLVYEMRTGTPPTGGMPFAVFEGWYHFDIHPTTAEYAYACQRANNLYTTLQSDREAQGLGPFDNTPEPLALRFGGEKPDVGSHCPHWPVTRPSWQAAEFHFVQHDGTITSFPLWVVKSEISMFAEQNQ